MDINTERKKGKEMSELICPVDGVHYFSEGILGEVCPCCCGREIISRKETLGYIEEPDFADHKKHQTLEDMLKHFKGYYGDKVAKDTLVKIIDFRVTRILK